jgi:probable phosphoglycerate mutase
MLVLIRHGESTFNQAERLSGRVETPLTELGQDQARRAGRVLGAIQELRASPLSRAVETAQLLGTGLEPIIDERLVELDFGVHDGANLSDHADVPQLDHVIRVAASDGFTPSYLGFSFYR